ncbi:hypothetical protein BDZ89DRAFT_824369 [Hymenopellis radicata]|nr:hypothetical protein BDZ89DRAFT_824369 [Hymenopellis radicata]
MSDLHGWARYTGRHARHTGQALDTVDRRSVWTRASSMYLVCSYPSSHVPKGSCMDCIRYALPFRFVSFVSANNFQMMGTIWWTTTTIWTTTRHYERQVTTASVQREHFCVA